MKILEINKKCTSQIKQKNYSRLALKKRVYKKKNKNILIAFQKPILFTRYMSV